MTNKLFLFRTMLALIVLCIIVFDTVLWLTGHRQALPHRNALLTFALLWFASVLFPQNSDDDWAGA